MFLVLENLMKKIEFVFACGRQNKKIPLSLGKNIYKYIKYNVNDEK